MCADMEKMLKNVKKESHKHISTHFIQKYKKGHIPVSVNEVDESRAYYTEWSKSETEQQILYLKVYMCVCVCVCV